MQLLATCDLENKQKKLKISQYQNKIHSYGLHFFYKGHDVVQNKILELGKKEEDENAF